MNALEMGKAGSHPGLSGDLRWYGWSHSSLTASDRQAQTLASRFCLSPWMARDMALLCFGGCCDD